MIRFFADPLIAGEMMSISSRRVPWRFLGPIQLVDATPSTMGAVDVEREVAVCGRARRDVTRNKMEMHCRPTRPGECGTGTRVLQDIRPRAVDRLDR